MIGAIDDANRDLSQTSSLLFHFLRWRRIDERLFAIDKPDGQIWIQLIHSATNWILGEEEHLGHVLEGYFSSFFANQKINNKQIERK
mgnify:CR=1 FL=1